MKENSIEEDIKIVENYLANSAINEIDSNFFKNGGWETIDLEIPKSMQHILSDYKRVLKENEVKDKQIKDLQYEEIYEYLEKISQDLDNVAIDQIPIAIAELKYKNQVTEKQIDLMAKYIDEIDVSEDICEGKTICDENCKDCIKQYFENKAKKGE